MQLIAQQQVYCYSLSQAGEVAELDSPEAAAAKSGKCVRLPKSPSMADPGELELSGNLRKESMPSSLGRIQLYWPIQPSIQTGNRFHSYRLSKEIHQRLILADFKIGKHASSSERIT